MPHVPCGTLNEIIFYSPTTITNQSPLPLFNVITVFIASVMPMVDTLSRGKPRTGSLILMAIASKPHVSSM